MARMGKSQYELLTETFGLALADVQRRESGTMVEAARMVISKTADALKYDNEGFNIKQFINGVESVAEITHLTDQGIH